MGTSIQHGARMMDAYKECTLYTHPETGKTGIGCKHTVPRKLHSPVGSYHSPKYSKFHRSQY